MTDKKQAAEKTIFTEEEAMAKFDEMDKAEKTFEETVRMVKSLELHTANHPDESPCPRCFELGEQSTWKKALEILKYCNDGVPCDGTCHVKKAMEKIKAEIEKARK